MEVNFTWVFSFKNKIKQNMATRRRKIVWLALGARILVLPDTTARERKLETPLLPLSRTETQLFAEPRDPQVRMLARPLPSLFCLLQGSIKKHFFFIEI